MSVLNLKKKEIVKKKKAVRYLKVVRSIVAAFLYIICTFFFFV